MKCLNINEKKPYEAPTMERLVITGREMMGSEHDNGYIDWGDFWKMPAAKGYYDG